MRSKALLAGGRYSEFLVVTIFLALLLWVLRFPASRLGLVYYDDGETLYHTLSLLSGQVPYRDDYSHHFLGYVLPVLAWAKVRGFSLELIGEVAFLTQLVTGVGVYLTMRLVTGRWQSVLAAAITLSIRQPWVWGFYQQYQINSFTVYILYFCFRYTLERKHIYFVVACLLSAAAITFDQRAAALLFIPACALFLQRPTLRQASYLGLLGLGSLGLALLVPLLYLMRNGALAMFYEQTFIYPRYYRVGSLDLLDIIVTALRIHGKLILDSTIVCVTALVGFLAVLRDHTHGPLDPNSPRGREDATWRLLLWSALPLAVMPFFGARDFPYYVATWYPYLGMMSVLSVRFFRSVAPVCRRVLGTAPALVVIIPLSFVVLHWRDSPPESYQGDGRKEVAEFLTANMKPEDSLYVWAYRLDIYAALQRLAALPMANRIMVHPDQLITTRAAREKHVYPPYEKLFLEFLAGSPPTYLVTFERQGLEEQPSMANDSMIATLASDYRLVHSIEKKDFLGMRTKFDVYRKNESAIVLSQ